MKILVIGGTGKVGTWLVRNLIDRHADLRVMTRSKERAADLPDGVEAAVADPMAAPHDSLPVFQGIDTLFMLNSTGPDELAQGLLAVELARNAGVRRVVFQSAFDIKALGHLPHLAPKLAIQRAIERSGMDWTFLMPNNFFQNDLMTLKAIQAGSYIQPLGMKGCSSVDTRDIAAAAAAVVADGGHSGKSYNIVGPETVTVEDCAALWSKALDRPVRFTDDVELWHRQVSPFMPAWLAYDLAMMYRHIVANGYVGDLADIERTQALVGRPLRRYEAFIEEAATAARQGGGRGKGS